MRDNNTFLKLALVLAVIGVLISGKLLSIHNRFATGQASLTESCGIGGGSEGCASIAVSSYSDIFGVPVAAIALGTYIALLLLGFLALKNQQGSAETVYVMFFLATVSVVVTVIMFVISNYVVKEFCHYCAMLWVVNLAIWPCLVKQLGLGWGNALAGNLELLGNGKANLRKERVTSSASIAVAAVVITSVIGLVAKAGSTGPQGPSTIVGDYANAQVVMLPAEAFGGPMSKGAASAPVMEIAEMADFQCPACKSAGQALRSFLLKHKDKVRITYHNFPLDGSCNPFVPNGGHRMACAAARGGICAAKQGKFWDFHDQVFDRQDDLSAATLEDIAKKTGLDTAAYEACLKDPSTETQLQQDMQYGEMINLQSTPTLVINGRKLIGGRTPADLEKLLDAIENDTKR